MILRALKSVPPAAWALLPGLVGAALWAGQEDRGPALRAEITRLEAEFEPLKPLDERNEVLKSSKILLTDSIDLVRELSKLHDGAPVHEIVNELFRMLPKDLAIRRLVILPLHERIRLDLLETTPETRSAIAASLGESALFKSWAFLDESEGGPSLDLVLSPPPETSP